MESNQNLRGPVDGIHAKINEPVTLEELDQMIGAANRKYMRLNAAYDTLREYAHGLVSEVESLTARLNAATAPDADSIDPGP